MTPMQIFSIYLSRIYCLKNHINNGAVISRKLKPKRLFHLSQIETPPFIKKTFVQTSKKFDC